MTHGHIFENAQGPDNPHLYNKGNLGGDARDEFVCGCYDGNWEATVTETAASFRNHSANKRLPARREQCLVQSFFTLAAG